MSDPRIHPARGIRLVTPNDSNDLPNGPCRGFHVNVAGDVVVHPYDSATAETLTVLAGVYYPYEIRRFLSTGTSATGIHALY